MSLTNQSPNRLIGLDFTSHDRDFWMNAAKLVSQAFDTLVQHHVKLSGSRAENLEIACETVLSAFERDPLTILGPICEQLTKTAKKARRAPYLNVAQWIHERATTSFDNAVRTSLLDFSSSGDTKRRAMGCCILVRSLVLSSVASSVVSNFASIVDDFTSTTASVFEMEIFNTAVFACSACGAADGSLAKCAGRFAIWMKESHPIVAAAASELVRHLKGQPDEAVIPLIPLMRTDIPPSLDRARAGWAAIVPAPFDAPLKWIEFGLAIGRCDEERLRAEIAQLSSEKGQFSSIISVGLSIRHTAVQNIARALFRFGIHGKEMAAFDPHSLSQILEQSDNLTGIAITFLSEMALANAQECVPQLFPLLQSDKPAARKNSLKLLSRILDGDLHDPLRQLIASNLLPMVGDDAVSVRVDIPKLFVSVPPSFIVPPLMKLLSDRDERKRSTASAAVKRILRETTDPAELLQTILDCALAGVTAPNSPAEIQAVTRDEQKVAQERALKLIEEWSSEAKGSLLLDPAPVLNRLWADPQNGTIVLFIAKSTPLYDRNRLISCLIVQLHKPLDGIFPQLSPLLVLRAQPLDFFTIRETVASPLFDLVYKPDEPSRELRRLRCEILARFPLSLIILRIRANGLFTKFSLCIICYAGQIHGPISEVCDEFEAHFPAVDDELFLPICDAFYFADRKRCLNFALDQRGSHAGMLLLDSALKKFQEPDIAAFVKSGQFDRLLRLEFAPEAEAFAVNLLFTLVFRAKQADLDGQWEQLFEIGSHFSDSRKPGCRLAALKLIAALLINPAMPNHLAGNLARIQHIVTVASEDWEHPEIQKVGSVLKGMMTPSGGAAIEEMAQW
jgi:hypothetical protein